MHERVVGDDRLQKNRLVLLDVLISVLRKNREILEMQEDENEKFDWVECY